MRGKNNIVQSQQWVIHRDWLNLGYIQSGGENLPRLERLVKGFLVDHGTARTIDKDSGWLHGGKLGGANQVASLSHKRHMDGDKICLGEQVMQIGDVFQTQFFLFLRLSAHHVIV